MIEDREWRERQRAYQARYLASPKGQATRAAYEASEAAKVKRRERGRRYRQSRAGAKKRTEYRATDGREMHRKSERKCLLRKYGLTLEAYDEMLARQGGVCALCGEPERGLSRGVVKLLAVDHCHKTGLVRGLLCSACNLSVGRIEAAPRFLERINGYLAQPGGG